nr:MAG TPA: hypothetical protein [Crassvirales sp.]
MKRTIESLTPPENKQVMWLDVSGKVKQLKVYINGEWVVVNDDTENNEEIVKKVLEKTYDASKSRTKRTFLAAPTNADGKADFRAITAEDLPDDIKVNILDLMSYGVSWKPNVGDPVLTRVGNMSYHKTLPIQNNMRGCIAQMKNGVKIMYFLNPVDWRWRENPRGHILKDQIVHVSTSISITNDVFSTLQYEHQWLSIEGRGFQVSSIDTTTSTAIVYSESSDDIEEGTYDIELGAVLNGYDGEVMVLVPEFWIKSWDTGNQREVRISPSKIDDTWEHQPRILIGAYHDTVLNTVPENMGYLSTLKVNSALSIVNTKTYCRGGNNSSKYDSYISSDRYRSLLGKPKTNITRETMRNCCRSSGKEILNYLQYKRVLYWLYVIEYANFNSQAPFKSRLTSEGFRQGGLGNGVTTVDYHSWNSYNEQNPLTPNGFTNLIGNMTGIITMPVKIHIDDSGIITNISVPRWHGIENPFGDIWNNVDGNLVKASSIIENGEKYNEVYATDDPSCYGSNFSTMRVVGIEPNDSGYIKEWALGNTAEIVPRLIGGNTTQYKCDHYDAYAYSGKPKLLSFGGNAINGGEAGLGALNTRNDVDFGNNYTGFRSSCVVP